MKVNHRKGEPSWEDPSGRTQNNSVFQNYKLKKAILKNKNSLNGTDVFCLRRFLAESVSHAQMIATRDA